jgi:hypothetical protein
LAEQGLFLYLTRLIWLCDIKPDLGSNVKNFWLRSLIEQGEEIPVDIFAYTDGENMRPTPFRARFIPRSKAVLKTMEKEAQEAAKRLSEYDGETKIKLQDFFHKGDVYGKK